MRAMRALRRRVQRLSLGGADARGRGAPAAARAALRALSRQLRGRARRRVVMRDILARANREVLRAVRLLEDAAGLRLRRDARADRRRPGAGGDAPRHAAAAPASWRARYPCVVISGRRAADVGAAAAGVRLAERRRQPRPRAVARRPASARARCGGGSPLLEARLRGVPGVAIEDKGLSLAVHYRARPAEEARRGRASWRRRAALGDVRLVGGKQVVNVLPAGAPAQGTGPRARAGAPRLRHRDLRGRRRDRRGRVRPRPARAAAGDPGRPEASSSAAYYIRGQAEIDACCGACWPTGGAGGATWTEGQGVKLSVREARPAARAPAAARGGARVHAAALGDRPRAAEALEAHGGGPRRHGPPAPRRPHRRDASRAISAGQLAQILHLHPSTLTGILRRLERRRSAHAPAGPAGRAPRRARPLGGGAAPRRRRRRGRSSP